MEQEITIHRDDLEAIIKLVDAMNPAGTLKLGSGYVTIYSDGKQIIASSYTKSERFKG